jgi:mannosyltransferase OCH1-like enzyme
MTKIVHQIVISDNSENFTIPNIDSIEKFFIKHDFILWDYKKIKNFMIKNDDSHVLEAMDSIKPYAFKADLARYYLIYKLGGWYTDLNNFFVSEPPNHNGFIFFRDVQELTNSSWSVACGLFYSEPNNKILMQAVSQILKNISEKYYGDHALCPTGPNLFGSVIASYNLPENNKYLIGNMKKNKKSSGFYFNDILFSKYKPNGLEPSNSGIVGGNNYKEMWDNRNVY